MTQRFLPWCSALTLAAVSMFPGQAQAIHPEVNADMGYHEYAGVWVSRFEYSSASAIRAIIADCAAIGFTDIQFQVRGEGDARYDSNFEVWSDDYPYYGSNPGWDPLQVATEEAAKYGIRLHAWINTTPMWRGSSPPSDPDHLWNQHPEWRLKDYYGNDQPLEGTYVGINPTIDEAQDHIANVAADIVANYDVAGVHLDYVRMYSNTGYTYVRDPASRARYTAETGLAYSDSPAYRQWIADNITELVTKVGDAIHTEDPNSILSAAVWRDPDIAIRDYQQHSARWIEEEILDLALPMTYLSETYDYLLESNVQKYASIGGDTAVVTGIGPYLYSSADMMIDQIERARTSGSHGVQVYHYSDIDSGPKRTALTNYLASIQPPPGPELLADFETDERPFGTPGGSAPLTYNVNASSQVVTTESAMGGLQSLRVDVDGAADGWTLEVLADEYGEGAPGTPGANIEFNAQGFLGMWVKTESDNTSISLILNDGTQREVATERMLDADGLWHLIQWDLDNPADWYPLSSRSGNGEIDASAVTLRSLRILGEGVSWLFMDSLIHNPGGMLEIVGDFTGNGGYEPSDLTLLAQNMGNPDYDLTGDGETDGDDLRFWIVELYGGVLGDINFDNKVNLVDLSTLAFYFQQDEQVYGNGDINGDGSVNLLDLSLLAQAFGHGDVPEPSTALLLAGSLAWIGRRSA
ncbi:family 10 glycosylhydrolase [Mucisphaera calidilacus]|uniref:Dockerin domain-containing protein n=1 Tax=Mucisphaera calidilacus TaxID=2527982 RepID=A0A518BZB4_9BACT|nr:family 10 glycosylhydrolase [Mucisphaera calidilacus]QDU72311.1 hypothetical protein Pan265_21760 [Mucisphaera calidilacus]